MGTATATEEQAGLSRRAMLQRAAAVGAAAWSAPVILGSLASPAAAVTGQTFNSGCFRAQWQFDVSGYGASNNQNLITNINGTAGNPQVDTGDCKWVVPAGLQSNAPACNTNAPNDKTHDSHQISVNRNCCHYETGKNGVPNPPLGTNQGGPIVNAVLDWWSCWTPDFTGTPCITVSTNKNPGGTNCPDELAFGLNDWVQISIDQTGCPDCWIVDAHLVMVNTNNLTSLVEQSTNDSTWRSTIRFTNTGSSNTYFPVYLKFWIGCSLKTDGSCDDDSRVPCTPCSKTTTVFNQTFT